jgi:hypothetical protein
MSPDPILRAQNPAFWTTAERLHEVFQQLETRVAHAPRTLALLRQVQALEAEFEAEVRHRSAGVLSA